ncbi:PWWP domain-containing protein 2A [Schistosoma japonicum]|nr:PWWP domain-containing protein 2A [Schistosoma japonicum]
MASSSVLEGTPISKGENILVKVEDFAGELISVKLINGDKIFRGILLQESIGKLNEYGTNLERVTSSPFWPPLSGTTSGINLKTIPCSTERYSYKLEGQPSNLNVFQPDPTRRSHRNQPAPQLSRILRPRRFVCRKCKKAFHLEEHGAELSSSVLVDQIDRRTFDSSGLHSDSEIIHCSLKSDYSDHITVSAAPNGNSQSIRHVTPSIIPKLNEEMKISVDDSLKSNIDSSSDVPSKSKKHFTSYQSTKSLDSLERKSVMPKKRKVDAVPEKQKLKKMKLTSEKLPEPVDACNEMVGAALPVTTSDSSFDPVVPLTTEETKCFTASLSLMCGTNSTDSLSSQEQIRKNRIKAQYVSVTSPFRFPFGKKARISTQEVENVNSVSDCRIKIESNTTRKHSEKPEMTSLTPSKTNIHGARKNSRNRTRTQLNASVSPESFGPPSSVRDVEECTQTNETSSNDLVDGNCSQKENIPSSISPRLSSPIIASSKEKHSSVQLTYKTSTSGHNSTSSSSGFSVGESNFSPQGRRKAFDYEKPKNRWMREARARRSQEERNVNPSSTVTSCSSDSSNNADTDNPASCNIQSPSLNRLRIRSGDGSSGSPSENAFRSNNNASKVKLHNGSSNNRNTEPVDTLQSDVVGQKSASTSHTSPCLTPTSETPGLSLPVLKIKINRNRQPSGCSKTLPTQYEVVKSQTVSHLESTSSVSQVINEEDSSIVNADLSPPLKSDIPCNGIRTPSPSPSDGSSKKGSTFENLVVSGPLVRRCKLHDGIVFRVGDLVWSKLSGWPYWPAQITSIQRMAASESDLSNPEQVRTMDSQEKSSPLLTSEQVCYTACLHWFAWHQVSYMPCDKLFHFLEHCKRFDNKKKRGVFRQAVNEAKQTADKRRETHSTDSESDLEHEVVSGTINRQSLPQQSSEIPVLNASKESELPQNVSSIPIPHMSFSANEVNATTKQCKLSCTKIRKGKAKLSLDKQETSVLCSVVNPLNASICQTTCSDMSSETATSMKSRSPVVSNRRSKQRIKNKVCPNTPEDKKVLPTEYDSSLTNSKSNVRLKIILSKPKSKGKVKCTKILSNNTQSSYENKINISSSSSTLDVPVTQSIKHQFVEDFSKHESETQCTSEVIPESDPATVDSEDFSKQFNATHSELLTQFPHVFPDLKVSGILSDTVDIPTFSEDESEEEDAGRLIIDPDVIASVNVPLSTGNHYITETVKVEPDIQQVVYSLSPNISYDRELSSQTFDNILPYSRTSATLPEPPMLSFANPVYSSDTFTHHSFNSSTYSTECLMSPSVPVYPTISQPLMQSVLPRLSTPPLLTPSSVSNSSLPSRTVYFQSNHHKVPSTTTHNVPYITTEYSTL